MISVILPTYNERENIQKMIQGLLSAFDSNNLDGNIIVVDDNSPDGTGDVVKKYLDLDNVHLIERTEKLGLGSAYIAGFKKAIDQGSEYIFEMDADMSHSPTDLYKFIDAAKEYDLVLGSRYIPQGEIENWNAYRKLISRGGTIYAKIILGMSVNDLTSGYKCFRRNTLRDIDFETAKSDGYSFQIELSYRAHKKGLKIKEVPITFSDRKDGTSKFSKNIFWEAIWMVWKLRLGK